MSRSPRARRWLVLGGPSFVDGAPACSAYAARAGRRRGGRARALSGWLLLLALLVLGPGARRADPGPEHEPDENEVKAAFVYKFLRYVEWKPERFEDEKSPLLVGVVGSGPIVRDIAAALREKHLGKRELVFLRFDRPEDVRDCHVLFLPDAVARDEESRAAVLARVPKKGVLVIGESEGFALQGGVINLYLDVHQGETRVRFEINPDEARRREVTIRAELLKLARIVRDPKPEPDHEQGNPDRKKGDCDRERRSSGREQGRDG